MIFSANEMVAPGIVVNNSTDRNMLLVGECDDRASERIERLRAALVGASILSPPESRIREAIWTKRSANTISGACLLTNGHVQTRPCAMLCRACLKRRDRPQLSGHQQHGRRRAADHKPSSDYERGRDEMMRWRGARG